MDSSPPLPKLLPQNSIAIGYTYNRWCMLKVMFWKWDYGLKFKNYTNNLRIKSMITSQWWSSNVIRISKPFSILHNLAAITLAICKQDSYSQITNVTGPAKTGHICTNYTCSKNGTFLGLYSCSVSCVSFRIDLWTRHKDFIGIAFVYTSKDIVS